MAEPDQPTAAAAIARVLVDHGVETVYCLPGEETIALLDACAEAGLRLVVARHEQHAGFMAATAGRIGARAGVLVTTLGPGATNALTPVAQAWLAGFPMLVICGQKPLRDNDEGSFQVLDLPALAAPISKRATTITDPAAAASAVLAGLIAAESPRPGPVLVELAEDVAGAAVEDSGPVACAVPASVASEAALAAAVAQVEAAASPVVLAGSASSAAGTAVVAFAEATGIGVVATQMAKGVVPEDHSLSLPALGLNRADIADVAVRTADLVIAVGYSPVEHPPLSWNPDGSVAILHLDAAPPGIERGYEPALALVGDVSWSLVEMSRRLTVDHSRRTERLREVLHREQRRWAEPSLETFPPTALDVVHMLRETLDRDDIVALDNGAYKVWFALRYAALAPGTLLLDNALATMGAGLATAMVAAMQHPDRRVVAVCGDGGFMMNVGDLETAHRLGLDNLTVVVLNDDAYGFIEWHQQEQGYRSTAVDVSNPDFADLAAAFGVECDRVTDERSLVEALMGGDGVRALRLIECPLDQSQNRVLEGDRFGEAMTAWTAQQL